MENNIVDKIKKLLEITQANGATAAEEQAALEKANILMEKYQIERWQLKKKSKNVQKSFTSDEKFTDEVNNVMLSISEFFGVIALKGTYNNSFTFYGPEEQAELALDMAKRAFYEAEINHGNFCLTDKYRQERRSFTRRQIKISFIQGFYIKVYRRLQELIEQRRQSMKSSTGTDLIVLNSETLSNEYEQDFNRKLKEAKTRNSKTELSTSALKEGYEKGDTFRILDEINN